MVYKYTKSVHMDKKKQTRRLLIVVMSVWIFFVYLEFPNGLESEFQTNLFDHDDDNDQHRWTT